jgi:hypothetical protein
MIQIHQRVLFSTFLRKHHEMGVTLLNVFVY